MKQHEEKKLTIDDLLDEAEAYEYERPKAHNKIHFTEKEKEYVRMMVEKGAPSTYIADQLTKAGKPCSETTVRKVAKNLKK